jgi:hypothetical protein
MSRPGDEVLKDIVRKAKVPNVQDAYECTAGMNNTAVRYYGADGLLLQNLRLIPRCSYHALDLQITCLNGYYSFLFVYYDWPSSEANCAV